tara:strand:+ start:411 stop:1175 length:765 start_codon:yes stop_codon:yes gene_type:complete
MGYSIGVCGDSGSGKTTLSNVLSKDLRNCLVLECDRYHRWKRGHQKWDEYTHLDIKANHIDMMSDDVNSLIRKDAITRCDYNHTNGRFTSPQEITPTDNLIVCGLHSLYCDDVFDVKIYMDTDDRLRTFWKISRDTKSRGHTFESVREQIEHRREDFEKYIKPQKEKADVIVNFYSDSDDKLDTVKGIGTKMKIKVKKSISKDFIYRVYSEHFMSAVVSSQGSYNVISFLSYPTSDVRYYYDYISILIKAILLK